MEETVLIISIDYKKSLKYIEWVGSIWLDRAIDRRAPNLISIRNLLVLAVCIEDKATIIIYKGRLHRPTIIVLLDAARDDKRLSRHIPFFHYVRPDEFIDWMRTLSALWRRRHPIGDVYAAARKTATKLLALAYGVPPEMIGRKQC